MLCLSGEDDIEHEVTLLVQVAVVADLVQTRALNPSPLQLHVMKNLSNAVIMSYQTIPFFWKTDMIYIRSFK